MENIENLDLLRPVSHTKRLDLVSGSGASMMTSDGKEYLDFNEICVVLGQNDRHFIDRMTKALGGVTSGKRGYSDDKLELYGYLDRTTGHAFKGIHLTSSGSETTEWAVKLAQKITSKSEVLSFWNSIHGRTHLSASMSGLPKRKTLYGPVCPGTANPSDIEVALSLGLKTVKFFPAEAAGGLKYIKSIAAPYVDMKFMPTGGVNEKNLLDYLSFNKIICCGGSWMVPGDAVKARDWDRIRTLTASAVHLMLGLEIAHVGINSADEAEAMDTATKLCKLLGWTMKVGNSSIFAGTGIEVMKSPFRGAKGHIGIKTNFIVRAKAYLERQGFEFDESSANVKDGQLKAIYLKDEIAGFAIHLVQK